MADGKPRLSKLMSERGLSSRREADDLIERGLVKVNGKVINELGTKVDPSAQIEILDAGKLYLARQVTIILHKPIGYVSSQPEKGYRSAMDLIRPEAQAPGGTMRLEPSHLDGLGPAGRLDIDSQGLMIYTQDGVLAKRIIGEDSGMEKEYLVRVSGNLTEDGLRLLRHGIRLYDSPLKPAKVEWVNEDQLRFILVEGKKRQIRLMCEHVGLRITGLKRVRVGRLMLGNLKEGQWRFLREEEYDLL